MLKRLISIALVAVLAVPAYAGLGSSKAKYVGGTVETLKDNVEGHSRLEDSSFVFDAKGGTLTIPYDRINSLEYGQKAGRRVGLAVVVSPVFLFSKKRKHFLTIGYMDSGGQQQAAVFELGKGIIRSTLGGLEAKTGRQIEFEDDEARKSAAK